MGFIYTASGPLVRSSYKAGENFISSLKLLPFSCLRIMYLVQNSDTKQKHYKFRSGEQLIFLGLLGSFQV